jgi:outer membrane biosynthesis protein TonB
MHMRMASAISTGLHAAVLLWALVSFSGKTFEVTPAESLPVDLVSEKDFSEMTKGAKDAPKAEKPKPLVEKKDEPKLKPIEDVKPKVSEKKEIAPTAEKIPEPAPVPKPDPIAEKLKQQDEKKQEAKAVPQPLPPKRPERKQPKFDADKIAALLDKRDPLRNAATGAELNTTPSLGAASGNAARLSQSEKDALRRRIASCWTIPVGAQGAEDLKVVFRVMFHRDGTVERGPDTVEGSVSPYGPAFAESGKRAILQCQPYSMLRPETYESWKDIEIEFSPRDMFP